MPRTPAGKTTEDAADVDSTVSCRESGFRTIVLNTTSAQEPAPRLYRKLGFREAARSFLGEFELVWFERSL